MLFKQGQVPLQLCLLMQGVIRGFLLNVNGKDITDCIVFQTGDSAMPDGEFLQPASINMEALEPSQIVCVDIAEVIRLMKEHPENLETYMEQFVDLQLAMHEKKAPRLTLQKDKFARKITSLKDELDATTRYELMTRLDSMPDHTKLCHGDFNPSNVIVKEDGSMKIVDWAHATQGNASGDAAITYLEFALKDQKTADLYLDIFCKKSDTAKQYVQKWLPIAAAAQLTKNVPEEKEFLRRWTDIIDFQ